MKWLFVFLCSFITCKVEPFNGPCPIELTPPSVVVKYGDGVSINCSSPSPEVEGMGWEASSGGIGVTEVKSLPWKIDSLTVWKIEPKCFISFHDGDQCLKTASVTVYKMPESVSVDMYSHQGPLVEKQTYTVGCDIVNVAPLRSLSVTMSVGDDIMQSPPFDTQIPLPQNRKADFSLNVARHYNGTRITCQAKLNLDLPGADALIMVSAPYELIVHYPPTFFKPETETVPLPVRGEITLNCTATGNPDPVYSWQVPHYAQQKTGNQPVLTSPVLLPGTYSCTASNILGNTTKQFIVTDEPGNRTTFAVLVGVLASLGVLLFIIGVIFVTRDGTFSFSKSTYVRGQSAPSGAV